MPDRRRSGEALKVVHPSQHVQITISETQGPERVIRERRLLRVIRSLESHVPRSVRELADEVRLSPTHLQRLFKQEAGIHISELLNERRLMLAANLLTSTQMGVKEIAYSVGYGHHSSFVRAFQRRFGQPPKRYRQACA